MKVNLLVHKNVPPVSRTHFHDGKLRKYVDKVQLCTVSASWIKLLGAWPLTDRQEQEAKSSRLSRLYLTGKASFSCFSSLLTAALFHLMSQLKHSFENSPKKFPGFLSLVIFFACGSPVEVLCLTGSCRGYTHERL